MNGLIIQNGFQRYAKLKNNCVVFGLDFSFVCFGVACVKNSCVIQYIYIINIIIL
jgi:hypothetical protein